MRIVNSANPEGLGINFIHRRQDSNRACSRVLPTWYLAFSFFDKSYIEIAQVGWSQRKVFLRCAIYRLLNLLKVWHKKLHGVCSKNISSAFKSCTLIAWSAPLLKISSSVSPSITKSQSNPVSRQISLNNTAARQ